MEIIIILLIVLLFVWLSSGFCCFYIACRRGKEIDWLDPAAVKQSSYAPYVDLIQNSHQWLETIGAEDLYIDSGDGLRLHGVWVPYDDARGTIILAHGYHSTKFVDFGKVMSMYHGLKLNVLMIDQRCHGLSEGRFITFGIKESEDLLSWVEYHNHRFGDQPIILSGLSMGASTALFLADHVHLPSNVAGIIADCGFSSPAAIIGKVFRDILHFSPGIILWSADLWARLLAGVSLYSKDSCKSLAATNLPVFLIHGKADDFVPWEMTQQAYDACKSDKEILLVESAGHGLSFLEDKDLYVQMIQDFLDRNLHL